MTKTTVIIIFLLTSLITFGQTQYEHFKQDFEEAIVHDFSEEQLNQMFSKYSTLLTPYSNMTQFTANLKGELIEPYPLSDFKYESLYKKNIHNLFNSKNSYHRILSYLVIAGAGDISFESGLFSKLKTETEHGNLIWAGMALMHLNTSQTTPLFDFLVENETFGDAHMLPLFVKLNKDSLQQTAYHRIKSDNMIAKILAAQILSYTELNDKTEELLKEAVREWDIKIKGYAIHSIKELQIGNLFETFKPLIDSSQTRGIAMEAMANSPTIKDRQHLYELVEMQDTVSNELLDCFLKSKNTSNVKYWLTILYSKPIPNEYIFSIFDQPILSSDDMLSDLHFAFEKITEPEVLHELVRALKGRTDEKSVEIMISLLKHKDSTVRYWAGWSLNGNTTASLIKELPDLLKNPSTRTVALVDLAIQNKMDTLQSLFVGIYSDDPNLTWKRSSVEYLSTFPLEKHRVIFEAILKDDNEDVFIRRNAAEGIKRLKNNN